MPFLIFALLGCRGEVTDVGNPDVGLPEEEQMTENSSPALEDLLGEYAGPADEADADVGDIIPLCPSELNAPKSIQLGGSPGKIVLVNFFDYGQSTQRITADYSNGQISFAISNDVVSLSCAGEATASVESIRMVLNCNEDGFPGIDCGIVFDKI
ncbi:MAG: hypothetical protein HY466_03205 [Deltaproteobacteria bacterium]|nr:hypothetical protein [Deltaproteobacteria bacterium]